MPGSRTTTRPTPTPRQRVVDEGSEDDVLRVDSTLVPIPVSVTSAVGRQVGDLKATDFALKVDGQTAEIGDLFRSETPVRLAMLFDNSSSVTIAREFEKKAAIKFFRRVIRPEKDLAALFSVASVTQLEQSFTKDVGSLVKAIDAFAVPEGATALLDGVIMASNYLGEIQGRRVIVIVSDGEDTLSDHSFEDAIKTAISENIQVYIVHTKEFENLKRTGQRGGNSNIRALTAERRMKEFASQTGGAVYSPIDEKELDEAFRSIAAELADQYIISYYPENDRSEKKRMRLIEVSIPSMPDAVIRTRKGYYVR